MIVATPEKRLLARLAGLVLLTAGCIGFPPQAAAADPQSPRPFASVWRIAGEVLAQDTRGPARRLQAGDSVFVGERISASATGEAVLKTSDAGIIAVRPGAVFAAERFVAEGGRRDSATYRIFTGALRVLTGWIGRLNSREQRIATPTATIGIRGTDHEPYVLTDDLAVRLGQKAGTYDKVNSGGTTLEAGAGSVDIDPGRVGFAKAPPRSKDRALMTLALPVLLDRIPDFYVPGRFDDEIDRLATTLKAEAASALERQRQAAPADGGGAAALKLREPSPLELTGRARRDDVCNANQVARQWLGELDRGIAAGKVNDILRLFDAKLVLRVNARSRDGSQSMIELPRDEFARSAAAAVANLSEFKQQRPNTIARPLEIGRCDRLSVRSVSIEQGRQGGTPYRFESLEEYVLEQRGQDWIAIKAESTQR